MSPRPGRITAIVDVDLRRARDEDAARGRRVLRRDHRRCARRCAATARRAGRGGRGDLRVATGAGVERGGRRVAPGGLPPVRRSASCFLLAVAGVVVARRHQAVPAARARRRSGEQLRRQRDTLVWTRPLATGTNALVGLVGRHAWRPSSRRSLAARSRLGDIARCRRPPRPSTRMPIVALAPDPQQRCSAPREHAAAAGRGDRRVLPGLHQHAARAAPGRARSTAS